MITIFHRVRNSIFKTICVKCLILCYIIIVHDDEAVLSRTNSLRPDPDTFLIIKKLMVKPYNDCFSFTEDERKLFLGATVSRVYSKYQNISDVPYLLSNPNRGKQFQYGLGLHAIYYFNYNFSIRSGIQYTKKRSLYEQLPASAVDSMHSATSFFSGKYVELPLQLRYSYDWEKFNPVIMVGVVLDMNVPNKRFNYYAEHNENERYTVPLNMNSLGVQYTMGIGAEYNWKKNIKVELLFNRYHALTHVIKTPSKEFVPRVNRILNTSQVQFSIYYKPSFFKRPKP